MFGCGCGVRGSGARRSGGAEGPGRGGKGTGCARSGRALRGRASRRRRLGGRLLRGVSGFHASQLRSKILVRCHCSLQLLVAFLYECMQVLVALLQLNQLLQLDGERQCRIRDLAINHAVGEFVDSVHIPAIRARVWSTRCAAGNGCQRRAGRARVGERVGVAECVSLPGRA